MATTKKAKALKRGDRVLVKDRLYALVDARGKLVGGSYGQEAAIYFRRVDATNNRQDGEKVIRLPDLDCEVI